MLHLLEQPSQVEKQQLYKIKAIARIFFKAMLKNDIKSQKSIVGLVKYFFSLFGRMVRTENKQTFLSERPGTEVGVTSLMLF